jgi:hypothetical protein
LYQVSSKSPEGFRKSCEDKVLFKENAPCPSIFKGVTAPGLGFLFNEKVKSLSLGAVTPLKILG